MIKKYFIILLFIVSSIDFIYAGPGGDSIILNGYISSMQSIMFDSLNGEFTNDFLLHNRLNFKAFLGENVILQAELRNRLFTGDMTESDPEYAHMTGHDQGWIDMSWNLVDEHSFFLNTTVDRLSLEVRQNQFEAKLGRQRINWGQTFVWNPNDIFNAYSFFDFDYVEKPGSDAIRLLYYPSFSSVVEAAAAVDHDGHITAAGLWRFNQFNYDVQFLVGYVKSNDLVAGAGWSGNIGTVSCRGEASYFQLVKASSDNDSRALVTIGFDKVLRDNSSAQLQFMFCDDPGDLNDFTGFYTGKLSAKDLAFSKFTTFGQFTWAATPLLNLGLSAMWFPDLHGYFTGPSVDYSLAQNIDFTFLLQHFNADMPGEKVNITLGFFRFRLSF